ncbi:MAG: MFS transporter [Pseudomonadota bacterium]
MRAYLQFLRANVRFLAVGFLLALCSTFGQTFYIAMYSEPIRAAFDLSHGEFGELYGLGTLASGTLIIFIGALIDRVDLRVYVVVLVAAMGGACWLMSGTANAWTLVLAIFALRICGQGLLSQAATVTMARYFDAGTRGRAVSVAALGFPSGQAIFPPLAVALLSVVAWRDAWQWSATAVVVVMPAVLLWLLRGHGERHAALEARIRANATPLGDAGSGDSPQWNRRMVLRDPRFFFAMVAMLAPSFIITGLNFHQVLLVQEKGWDLQFYAAGFAIYAGCQVASSIVTGTVIDRVGSRRVAGYYLLPLAAASASLSLFEHQLAVVAFMAFAGMSGGAGQTVVSTLWAELYGVRHLGSIRALVAGMAVISSAAAPAVFGWFIDAGVRVDTLSAWCAGYAVCGAVILRWLFSRRRG